jgi:uncharacterized protein
VIYKYNLYFCSMVERTALIAQIQEKLKKFPCVILIGLRQVGKTTISRRLGFADVKYIDLEIERDRELLALDSEEYLSNFSDKLIVIDEVQILPKLFSELRPILDRQARNGQYVLLGSANPSLIRGVSESLTGRAAYVDVNPLSIGEVGGENMQKRWLRGGLPKSYLANTNEDAFEWLYEYLRSYVERDLAMLFGIPINVHTTRNLLKILCALQGSMLNTADLSRSLGISNKTVNQYLDVLEGGFFIQKLTPYFANIGKRLVKSSKVYISDEGILHSMLSIHNYETLIEHPIVGASWEGYVINQIKTKIGRKCELYFYRTQVGAEIDILLVKNNRPYVAIEIKYSNTPKISRGFYSACEDLGIQHKYVITKSEGGYKIKDTHVVSLVSFLESEIEEILSLRE